METSRKRKFAEVENEFVGAADLSLFTMTAVDTILSVTKETGPKLPDRVIRPKECSIYNIIDPYGLKLLTRLRVNLSHLREHKFRHNFLNTLNPLCSCMLETESTGHYLLRCPFYADVRKTLFDNIINTIGSISSLSNDKLIHLLLYGKEAYSVEVNAAILKYTIVFLKSSERFDMALI